MVNPPTTKTSQPASIGKLVRKPKTTSYPPWAEIIKELPKDVEVRTIRVDGREHAYRIYVPDHSRPGGNGNGEGQIRHFAPHAEKEKFIAVWPRWDLELRKEVLEIRKRKGREAGRQAAIEASKTEVARMRAIVDDVAKLAQVDRSRIFAFGVADRCRFSHLLHTSRKSVAKSREECELATGETCTGRCILGEFDCCQNAGGGSHRCA